MRFTALMMPNTIDAWEMVTSTLMNGERLREAVDPTENAVLQPV